MSVSPAPIYASSTLKSPPPYSINPRSDDKEDNNNKTLHILLEKPMTTNVHEAIKLHKIADTYSVKAINNNDKPIIILTQQENQQQQTLLSFYLMRP